jgi:hypothetical protein
LSDIPLVSGWGLACRRRASSTTATHGSCAAIDPCAQRPYRTTSAQPIVSEDAMRNVIDGTDLFEIIRTTRSMRRLKPDPVPNELI